MGLKLNTVYETLSDIICFPLGVETRIVGSEGAGLVEVGLRVGSASSCRISGLTDQVMFSHFIIW